MKNEKNNKGITLMALVITIVILIILASIGTYSGIQVVKSAQFTAFSTELKIMQTQVNKLYEEKKNGNDDVDALGKTISSSSTTVQSHATNAFNASGITDTSNYKYFDTDTIKSLNIEGVEGEFFVNIDKRSVVSYDGFEYEGKTYYTLEQLPDGLYNVEHNTSEQQPDFNVDYELLENGKCKISVNNINYNGNINKWKVKYKKENEEDWKQSNNYSFIIDELGNYRVKIANNNIESREKQIMAKSSQLPSEYQQVEYIESTGTQYIDTGVYLPYKADFDIYYKNKKSNTVGNVGFGYYNDNGFTFEEQSWNASNAKNILIFDTNWSDGYSFPNSFFNTIRHIELIGNNLYIDEELYSTYERIGDNVANNSLLLGAYRENNRIKYNSGIIMGKMKFLHNNEVLFNGIPCYRKSDNKPGLFDLVNNVFYTNQGTGNFEIGKDIDSGETINTIIINNL